MKYLIISDIHGCLPALQKALKFYREEHCDMLVILGDILNYGPRNGLPEGLDPQGIVRELNAMADEIVAIRGNCDSEVDQMLLDFPIMADSMLLVDSGRRILLTHGHIYNETNMPRGPYDAIVYGHTHLYKLEQHGSLTVCNTGSITFPKGGNPPTMVVYENGEFKIIVLP
ncbi:phosphodiesterase family protein [Prevotella sp. DNF00663]|uniref:phosphodiesterase n=1 Tax=unclassified Prevotella TaxID=2638335 RepID=UPI00051402B2|nr:MULTISPECIES: phosphodiesterase [unclassified Prevotella]KGI60805.1 phosphodiesterase [Prevotella sp. S7 MS 2]KXB84039.1 phosphodiesterase family protein [Prevotella sp. DNF00663]